MLRSGHTAASSSSPSSSSHVARGEACFQRMDKCNAEVLALLYGATVRQLLVDFDGNFDKVNGELYKMGNDIGARLIDEFLIKSRVPPCQDFRDACEVMSKVALKMYLGVTGECVDWDDSAEGRKCRLVLPVNPLNDFVELPIDLRRRQADDNQQESKSSGPILYYSNILCGVIAGAMEQLRMNVAVEFESDVLLGDDMTAISLELLEIVTDEIREDSDSDSD
ncbi:Trafficking protein particle complex subunit 3 [Perkinsus chesapeaki]|uniref:Trafficking protein particle complex subunit 3 n=1 Tax=Perkinsus chesapeaki TaxID=330153 RepID=A0A7J6LYW5_PERCH|nr:Trafficking protein particle complex subunit 3 [Perkinsus chesapeaki]